MKYALCVENFSVFNKFYHENKYLSLPFVFLDRNFCENPKVCANVQIIPTATFITSTPDQYKILYYTRPSSINEKRLAYKRTVVFGGHIDSIEDIGVESVTQDYLTNRKIFTLTKPQFDSMIERVRRREIKEELTIDILDYKPQKVIQHLIYTNKSEVSSLHIGINAFYYFDEDNYNRLFENIDLDDDEVKFIDEYTFDYKFLDEIKNNKQQDKALEALEILAEELNFEDWGIVALQEFLRMHTN